MRDPGIISVKRLKTIAYHSECGLLKFGAHTLTARSNRYGATSKSGGTADTMAIIHPKAKPYTTCGKQQTTTTTKKNMWREKGETNTFH